MMFGNGIIDINGIEIFPDDNLTEVLKKTINIEKSIKNENNLQILYFEKVLVCKIFTNITLIFSTVGKLQQTIIGFSMYDTKSYDIEIFQKFFTNNKISNPFSFENGRGELIYEPHFKEYNIKLTYN